MSRAEFVELLVLNSICDDFESLDQCILRDVARDGLACGLTIERAEVVVALRALVERGLAKVYDLLNVRGDPFGGELAEMPSLDEVDEYHPYFFITEEGLKLVQADDWWPFDEEGALRPDWQAPQD